MNFEPEKAGWQSSVFQFVLLAALLLVLICTSLLLGAVHIPLFELPRILFGQDRVNPDDAGLRIMLYEIRLPRTLMAVLVGAGLSCAGVVYQSLLKNVLADPFILGISGGAAMGAVIVFTTGLEVVSNLFLPVGSFIGALSVAALVFALSFSGRSGGGNPLLLYGVMAGSLLSSLIIIVLSLQGKSVRNILYWLVGYLGNSNGIEVAIVSGIAIPVIFWFVYRSSRLNIITMGDDTAAFLGLSVRGFSLNCHISAAILTSVMVCFTGPIAFVGLVIPQMGRILFGADHRRLLPAATLLGASFLLGSDIISRTAFYPVEIPVGAVTSALGAPIFILLLRKAR